MMSESEHAAWSGWCQSVHAFWDRHKDRFPETGTPPGEVLVDAQVGMPHYLFGTLQIGNYLRIYKGLRPVAWTRRESGAVHAIARSFGIHDAVYVTPEDIERTRADADAVFNQLPASGDALRAAVAGLTWRGVLIGDLIYDDVLRNHSRATIETRDSALGQAIHSALAHFAMAARVFAARPIRAIVTGHVVYTHFGVLVRVALSRGIPVYGRKAATQRFTIRRYDTPDEARCHEFFLAPDEIHHLSADTRARLTDLGTSFIRDRFKGATDGNAADLKGAFAGYDQSKPILDRAALLGRVGLDPSRPTVAVMSHALPDAPHSGAWQMHEDYLIWLKETLKLAATLPEVNFLVKAHPDTVHYGLTALEPALVIALNAPNVKRFPDDVNTASLTSACDAVTTVRGTAGLEFAVCGKPVVLAGQAPYSGWGFTLEPRTFADYATMLRHTGTLPAPSADAQRQAGLFAGLSYDFCRVPCAFLPEVAGAWWNHPKDWSEQLAESRQALDTLQLEDDAVFRNLGLMLRDNHRHLMNHEQA